MALKQNTGVNALKQHAAATQQSLHQKSDAQSPIVIQNQEHEKKKHKYLRLDITNCQDYIRLMAEHEKTTTGEYVSMTKYILNLIDADKQRNFKLYEKLLEIENLKQNII